MASEDVIRRWSLRWTNVRGGTWQHRHLSVSSLLIFGLKVGNVIISDQAQKKATPPFGMAYSKILYQPGTSHKQVFSQGGILCVLAAPAKYR